jgi:hypothetical protein
VLRGKAADLQAALPGLVAEAAKLEADMAAAQAQSQDADITDEGREALLERIQSLTAAEKATSAKQQAAEEVRAVPCIPPRACHGCMHDRARCAPQCFVCASRVLHMRATLQTHDHAASHLQHRCMTTPHDHT